jgi:starch synthase (maltosyl-transferring)
VFKLRAVLASMMSSNWGVYSGYELFEHVAVRPGSEEYLDSEKYQYRPRDWSDPPLAGYLTRLNEIRRDHPALHALRNLRFHASDNESVICFSKRLDPPPGMAADTVTDTVLVVVNLDPHAVRETTVRLDMPSLGLDWTEGFDVVDELTGATYAWGQANYVRLDPFVEPAHIFSVRPRR